MLVSDNAAYGGTLNDLEEFFLIQGRHFLKETFAQKLQERTEATSKAKQCSHCKKTRSQDEKTKGIVSVYGDITLERCFRYCWHCQHYSFSVEGALCLATGYTTVTKRYASRLCGLLSYRVASDTLKELCAIPISHTRIGDITDATAEDIVAKQSHCPTLRAVFQMAAGETEFLTDGTCDQPYFITATHAGLTKKTSLQLD